MTKEVIHQQEITMVNVYTPNARAPSYLKQVLTDLRVKIGDRTIMVWGSQGPINFSAQIHKMRSQQRGNRSHTEQMGFIDLYSTFHPIDTEYAFFISTWNLLQDRACYMSKNMHHQLEKLQIIPCIFSDYRVKIDIDKSK